MMLNRLRGTVAGRPVRAVLVQSSASYPEESESGLGNSQSFDLRDLRPIEDVPLAAVPTYSKG